MIEEMEKAISAIADFMYNDESPSVQAMVQAGEAAMGFTTITPTGRNVKVH